MSLVVEAVSSSTNMGLEENKGDKTEIEDNGDEKGSESSICETEDEGEDAESHKIDLGPQYTLKQQFEKDKDDESLTSGKNNYLEMSTLMLLENH